MQVPALVGGRLLAEEVAGVGSPEDLIGLIGDAIDRKDA